MTTQPITRPQGRQQRPALLPGAVIDGRWRVVSFDLVDEAGEHYRAVDIRSAGTARVVVGARPLSWDAAWLEHPYALRTLSTGAVGDRHYVVQEVGEGALLASTRGAMPLTAVLAEAVGLADALDHLHHEQGMAHGRLGPHSVWCTASGGLRLADLAYGGAPGVDPSEDQRALAEIVHLLATGSSARVGIAPDLPGSLEQLLRIALSEHASWRFPTMRGMKRALERALVEAGGVVVDPADSTTAPQPIPVSGSLLDRAPAPAPVPAPSAPLPVAEGPGDGAPHAALMAGVATLAAGLGFGLVSFGGLAVVALAVVAVGLSEAGDVSPGAVAEPVTPVAVVAPPRAAPPPSAPVPPTWDQAPVTFGFDSWEPRPSPAFARFAEDVRSWDGGVTLTGHTDRRGTREANQVMGLGRAWAVEVGLLAYDVDDAQVEIRSAGETQLLTEGSRPEDHARNRRVTVDWH